MITLTNGVQIPENAVQLQTTAAIDGYYVTQPLRLVQYDETLPVAAVQLTYQNQPYTPPTGAELNVRMGKPDGTIVYNPCLGMDSSGIVYFAFTQQMTIVAGTGTLTVEITDSGVKNSAPIIAEIRPNPVPEGSIESADEFLSLQEILAEAEKWGQIVQANASNIQQVVDNLEDIQNAAENAQAAAASAAAAQQAAQEALGFRTFFSAVTPDANGNLDPSRPMTVGPAASVEIESAGDRIQSVTAFGFTTQAGTGDPSPTNVRAITNGGIRYGVIVYDGSSDESYTANNKAFFLSPKPSGISPPTDTTNKSNLICDSLPSVSAGATWSGTQGISQAAVSNSSVQICVSGITTGSELREWLKQNPITVWYPLEAGSLYAPEQIRSGEYRATCLPLTAPLCEGDSVVSWAKSGCDKVVTLDGSLSWTASAYNPGLFYVAFPASDILLPSAESVAAQILTDRYRVVPKTQIYSSGPACCIQVSGALILIYDPSIKSLESFKEIFNTAPLSVWYHSTSYTEKNDIPVSLETHQRTVLVLDGTEVFALSASPANLFQMFRLVNGKDFTAVSDRYKNGGNRWNSMPDFSVLNSGVILGIRDSRFSTAEDFKAELAAQYAAGTPVTIVYQLAIPITYAHPAVVLEAATGDQLTYTVTGQSGGTVSVALKPFQDGGHAATADNSQQLDGLTLSALQNLLVPVGYIFSWAPTSGGPDLSTPAKVAAYFGFGTWQAYGTGRVLVGVDSGQTEFNTVGQTGGEKTHTLTTNEMPSHAHQLDNGNDLVYSRTGASPAAYAATQDNGWGLPNWTAVSVTAENTGGGQAHNNLQPYIVVYRWQRIA